MNSCFYFNYLPFKNCLIMSLDSKGWKFLYSVLEKSNLWLNPVFLPTCCLENKGFCSLHK